MTKHFSKIIDRYFNNWIKADTWHTMHPSDMKRFYLFLKASKRYSRKSHWTAGLYENILKAAKEYHPNLDENYIQEKASRFTDKAGSIFAYEEAGPFPHPLVEMSDPNKVSLYLSLLGVSDIEGNIQNLYSSRERDEILAKKFPEWFEKESRKLVARLINIASSCQDGGEKERATKLYEEALNILQERLPNEKQTIVFVMEKLGEPESED